MGNLGFTEMLLIFVVALLVFGPKKLPELGKSLGKGIREFRKATDELKSSWEDQVRDIQAPLNDVKRDIHSIGQGMKDDFYKSIEAGEPAPSEQPKPVEVEAAVGHVSHGAHGADGAPEAHAATAAQDAHTTTHAVAPSESSAPKEHV
jgi:TatA/E family protein of Tat protein translocase